MIKKLDPAERKTLLVWLIVGITVFVLALLIKLIQTSDILTSKYSKEKYTIVDDYSRYYTVIGAVNKYYSFINAKEYERVLHVLDSKYVEEKDIDKNTLINYIPESEVALSFKGDVMCSKDLKAGITSYLVKGQEVTMNTGEKKDTVYYEVILDGNTFLFSMKPIEESFYGGNCNG